MTKLEDKLHQIRNRKRIGIMTHVVIGYPSIYETVRIVKVMSENGADIVELQIPFSDPIADGPTIMQACQKSLQNGTRVKDAFLIMKNLSSQVKIPLLFMAYFNTVFKYGSEKFCHDANKAGASGLIVPDMPIDEEEKENFLFYCKKYNLHNIRVISPVSNEERLRKNASVANGFIYCTARQGITGVKDSLDTGISTYLKKVRQYSSIPIAIGFGISKAKHIKSLSPFADIAVIGSVVIELINKSDLKDLEKNLVNFLNNLSG